MCSQWALRLGVEINIVSWMLPCLLYHQGPRGGIENPLVRGLHRGGLSRSYKIIGSLLPFGRGSSGAFPGAPVMISVRRATTRSTTPALALP